MHGRQMTYANSLSVKSDAKPIAESAAVSGAVLGVMGGLTGAVAGGVAGIPLATVTLGASVPLCSLAGTGIGSLVGVIGGSILGALGTSAAIAVANFNGHKPAPARACVIDDMAVHTEIGSHEQRLQTKELLQEQVEGLCAHKSGKVFGDEALESALIRAATPQRLCGLSLCVTGVCTAGAVLPRAVPPCVEPFRPSTEVFWEWPLARREKRHRMSQIDRTITSLHFQDLVRELQHLERSEGQRHLDAELDRVAHAYNLNVACSEDR